MGSFVSYNPATGEVLGSFPAAGAAEVACALRQAREAAEGWRERAVAVRVAALDRLRVRLADDADGLAESVTREIGKPLQEAYGADLIPSLNALDWLVRSAPRLLRARRIAGRRGVCLLPEPFGVVGVIGTWNYPLFLNLTPIAWALAAGNAVVWKPSELATATALRLAKHFERAGLPVVTLTGEGATGRALCRAGCDKIAFTGGVETGRAILAQLASTGTPSVMELSGNDALIVCADAPLALAARSAVWGRCCNAGQSCVAPQRLYVVREVYARFLQEAQAALQALQSERDFGPLRTEALRCRAHQMVWEAVPRGARLLAGGYALSDRSGFYYAPTLLADCHAGMPALAQDFFGPVLAVCPVADEEEAIACANASEQALGASVWTRDLRRGQQIAARLRVGMVAINDVLLDAADPALPFGGLRAGGFGKQRGAAGLDEFVQWKVVAAHKVGGARRHLFPYRPATLPILRAFVAWRAARGATARARALKALAQAAQHWQREEQERAAASQEERQA